MVNICLVLGTRPQIIKSAPLIHELTLNNNVNLKIIHTGQHYDYEMSKAFFEELLIPDPYCNLGVGAGSPAHQIAEIVQRLEKALSELKFDSVLVPGDTNSALASALTSVKVDIPVVHIESGARCYDMLMAEEVNRRVVDHISTILFAVSKNCVNNLEKETVLGKTVLSGDTMYDVFLQEHRAIQKSEILEDIGLDEYCVLTLHRAENVDNENRLRAILGSVNKVTSKKIIFPVHPRTRRAIKKSMIKFNNLVLIDPIPYNDMMRLVLGSIFVLTDSGGLQKEAFWCKTPCITLRERTEWVETTNSGVNFVAGTAEKGVSVAIQTLLKNYDAVKEKFETIENPYGDGRASKKIVNFLLGDGELQLARMRKHKDDVNLIQFRREIGGPFVSSS
jgi:UDP-N-acetylglucosamine 2-epimerase